MARNEKTWPILTSTGTGWIRREKLLMKRGRRSLKSGELLEEILETEAGVEAEMTGGREVSVGGVATGVVLHMMTDVAAHPRRLLTGGADPLYLLTEGTERETDTQTENIVAERGVLVKEMVISWMTDVDLLVIRTGDLAHLHGGLLHQEIGITTKARRIKIFCKRN